MELQCREDDGQTVSDSGRGHAGILGEACCVAGQHGAVVALVGQTRLGQSSSFFLSPFSNVQK